MDTQTPEMVEINPTFDKPSDKKSRLKTIALWEVGIFETMFVVLGLILIFGVLNYFNVLPVSGAFPLLSFLPKQQRIATNINNSIVNNTNRSNNILGANGTLPKSILRTIPFTGCPVEQAICKQAVAVKTPNVWKLSFAGLPPGANIFAVTQGKLTTVNEEKNGKKIILATLTNEGRNIQANYEFIQGSYKESSLSATMVNKGQVIGSIISKVPAELTFSIQNLNAKQYIKVTPSPDGKDLDNID